MAKNLVIVESPAKAKTINKYLGSDFSVIASFGHVRDLPSKNGSVDPKKNFAMHFEVSENSGRHIIEIIRSSKMADHIYLASDPDREGEAMAGHIKQILLENNILGRAKLHRVTFNQITKKAVLDAMASPRDLDQKLIDAYLARRALDYLVGFSISPVLWRKLPGSRSAGRVQSVALRIICDREAEIERFKSQEYWSIILDFLSKDKKPFSARLTHLNGKKLEKFDINSEKLAKEAVASLTDQPFTISKIEKKQSRRYPSAPFITSTLQQEASRKLGFGASRTMKTAQQLYEGINMGGETVGLITYMRTDGVQLAPEAVEESRAVIAQLYGKNYMPEKPRIYKSKAKNAQEAHEAIRPTSLNRMPEQVAGYLSPDQAKLYELIWKRTMASQMSEALIDQTSVDLHCPKNHTCRANGSVIAFDGFLKLYQESFDEPVSLDAKSKDKESEGDQDEGANLLPQLFEKDPATTKHIQPNQHFTQPPPRYTEASLVKRLEELGIGRPSTYASIISVLQNRNYVTIDKKRFIPESRGLLVTAFLVNFFEKYVEYDFTANLEELLDHISEGTADWIKVLHDFWADFSKNIEGATELRITDVLDRLNIDLEAHFFPAREDGSNPRLCPLCKKGKLNLKLGKFGAFAGCDNYPDCTYTKPLSGEAGSSEGGDAQAEAIEAEYTQPKILGVDPKTGLNVSLRKGPYGLYLQLDPDASAVAAPDPVAEEGAETEPAKKGKGAKASKTGEKADKKPAKKPAKKKAEKKEKPKRASLPKGVNPETVTLEQALTMLALPRDVGIHPESGEMITANNGRFGPYVKHKDKFKSIPKSDDLFTIGVTRAVELLNMPVNPRFARKAKPAAAAKAKPGKAVAKKAVKKPAKKTAAKPKTPKA